MVVYPDLDLEVKVLNKGGSKVFDPVAVEALLGDEKLNRASGDVESHISIRWATLLVVRQVWESWSKPHNLYVSGRMV